MLSFTRRATVSPSAPSFQLRVSVRLWRGEPAGPVTGWAELASLGENYLNCSKTSIKEANENTISAHSTWNRLECGPLLSFRNSQRRQEEPLPLRSAFLPPGFNQSNTKLLSLGGKQIPWNTDGNTLSPWSYLICPSCIRSNLF